jgi:hypothetical protein
VTLAVRHGAPAAREAPLGSNRWQFEIERQARVIFPAPTPHPAWIHLVPGDPAAAGCFTTEVRATWRLVDRDSSGRLSPGGRTP